MKITHFSAFFKQHDFERVGLVLYCMILSGISLRLGLCLPGLWRAGNSISLLIPSRNSSRLIRICKTFSWTSNLELEAGVCIHIESGSGAFG